MSKAVLQRNLELWSQVHPREALLASNLYCDSTSFSRTKSGELNLRKKNQKSYSLHASSGAKLEAKKWFSSLDLDQSTALCVFGVGLGYGFTAAKNWLKKNPKHLLIFLENDLEVIYRLCETPLATKLLSHPQVRLYFFHNLETADDNFMQFYWFFLLSKITVSALPTYEKVHKALYHDLKNKILYDIELRNMAVQEYLQYGYNFFNNFYSNLRFLPHSYLGDKLFGEFKGVPAIICGAGPSLSKNISFLQSCKGKALIFAGGSALNALQAEDVPVDFAAGIDPNPPQFERLKQIKNLDIPFFYRNRMYHEALSLVKGPRLLVTGSGGYDIAEWFEKELGLKGHPIQEGYNVVNFCLEIAHAMGCNPIIFVGLDLAYTQGKLYAHGVVQDASMKHDPNAHLLKDDIYGKPIYTEWKWVQESTWITEFAKMHPETEIINATEGGLGCQGVPNITLKKAIGKYLKRTFRLKPKIDRKIASSSMPQVTKAKVKRAVQKLHESLKSCITYLQILHDDAVKMRKKVESEKSVSVMQSGQAALAETEIVAEPAYKAILEIFNTVYSRTQTHEIEQTKFSAKNNWEIAAKRLKLSAERYEFLINVAKSNLALIETTYLLRYEFSSRRCINGS